MRPAADAAVSADLAVFPWGDPRYTEGVRNTYPRPPWIQAAAREGGLWITNDTSYGWQPAVGDWYPGLTTNRLLIQLDRSLAASNLWLAVAAAGEPGAALLAGFYDRDFAAVAPPVTLHVSSVTPWFTNRLDLAASPSACIVALSATDGVLRVYCSALFWDSTTPPDDSALFPPEEPTPTSAVSSPPATDSPAAGAPIVPRPPTPAAAAPISSGATVPRRPPRTWHVNATVGDDGQYDGTAPECIGTLLGPKKTIRAALALAGPGDTLIVAPGRYPGRLKLDGIRLITKGRVELQ
jgi:hypothetical protein